MVNGSDTLINYKKRNFIINNQFALSCKFWLKTP
jgi:hypothetical protein